MAKKFKLQDFVGTISDSEEDIPDLDVSEDERPVETTKKSKKAKEVDEEQDLDPNFRINLDGDELTETFEGWDFAGDETEAKKDVDLDGIIRRKGGLVKLAGVEDEEEEEEEEQDDSDDEDLAMDGFGMGAKQEDDEEEEEDEEEDEEDEDENTEEIPYKDSKAEDLPEEEEDSAEAIADFYASPEEAPKTVHKTFQSLSLSRPVLKGLANLGFASPSPIQSASIPVALSGKDIIAGAQTGSGKTAAYMIPIIERLLYKPAKVASTRVVVLTPTRELAIQVSDVGKKIGKFVNGLTFGLAVGGLNLRQQEQALKARPDIVIATPGRFIDHIRNSASFSVDSVEILVVDEADRMLEEGFQQELTEILSLIPAKRQTLLFSATMNNKIKDLVQLSLKKPVRIMIDPPKQAASKLVQEFVRIRKRDHLKPAVLFSLIKKIDANAQKRIVVFVSRKEMAHRLRIILGLLGMKVSELHGSLTQEQRLQSVNAFKSLEVPVLICTDLASRGLDIPKIEVVINFDMPKTHEIYLHRVGRTARAGREGRSISFVGESTNERAIVKAAIKSVEETKDGKVLGRQVDWIEVENLNKILSSKEGIVDDVLEEEKQEKEILRAEMELTKGENLLKHSAEIASKPRRTWFQSEAGKKNSKMVQALSKQKIVNSKKRKRQEEEGSRSYKKTKNDRSQDQERTFKKQTVKKDGKKKKPAMKRK